MMLPVDIRGVARKGIRHCRQSTGYTAKTGDVVVVIQEKRFSARLLGRPTLDYSRVNPSLAPIINRLFGGTNMSQTTPVFGHSPVIQIRLQSDLWWAIEGFRRKEPDIPTRPEAVRRLIQRALGADEKDR